MSAFIAYHVYVAVKPDCFRAKLQLFDALMDGAHSDVHEIP